MPHSRYLPEKMGSAGVLPAGRFEAGSFQEFTVTYRAGYFGIDDSGSIKIVHRFASDMGRPQFTDPGAPNYTTVEASNGAVLQVEYDMKRNIRPWDKTLYIKVVRGFLREGDEIIVRFGDRRQGSPGIRLQTFCEETFEFRVLVDAIATYNYVELPQQPTIAIVAGPAAAFKAILPTLRRVGEPFSLRMKGEDRWGNPSDLVYLFYPCGHLGAHHSAQTVHHILVGRSNHFLAIDDFLSQRAGCLPVANDLLYQRIGYIVGDTLKHFIQIWVLLRTGRLLCSRVAESCPAGLIPHSTWSGTLKHGVGPARPNRCGKKIPQRRILRIAKTGGQHNSAQAEQRKKGELESGPACTLNPPGR